MFYNQGDPNRYQEMLRFLRVIQFALLAQFCFTSHTMDSVGLVGVREPPSHRPCLYCSTAEAIGRKWHLAGFLVWLPGACWRGDAASRVLLVSLASVLRNLLQNSWLLKKRGKKEEKKSLSQLVLPSLFGALCVYHIRLERNQRVSAQHAARIPRNKSPSEHASSLNTTFHCSRHK